MTGPRRLGAVDLRDEWLGHALSTQPADRPAAEAAITLLYERLGRPAPAFTWVDSPGAALARVPPGVPVQAFGTMRSQAGLSIAQRLATLVADLRAGLDDGVGHAWAPGWTRHPDNPIDSVVRAALLGIVRDGICTPIRLALPLADRLTWYGQHDAYWIAHYDAWHRVGGRTFGGRIGELAPWAQLARSCGWWWPLEDRCVIAERPLSIRLRDGRLHSDTGPAVTFPDGWSVYALGGFVVPEWVVTGPTPELIENEPNVEVRRLAIERLGWDRYIETAGLRLVATAPDPGNPGFDLKLYDLPRTPLGYTPRVLLAVNGSVERDGTRRRYGLGVPHFLDDPVAAAAWTYGLSACHYSQLARRT
ncbi:DUF6745 domain-containing protein [Nonomuraea typhae]|uniref:DUF6745 domain-containing protein n=1 Tax=Nonomuraea typhae TaxID=2603600 RepID=UPI0012FC096A|nr:hypothetical protein [Nonomuraea typhae]